MGFTQKTDREPIFLLPLVVWQLQEGRYCRLVVFWKGMHHLGSVARVAHRAVMHEDRPLCAAHRAKLPQSLVPGRQPDIGPRGVGRKYRPQLLGEGRRVQDSRSALVAEPTPQPP